MSAMAFSGKLRVHRALLQQLSEFDVRTTAKCSVASDRPMLQAMISRLYDGIDDAPIAVAIEATNSERDVLLPQTFEDDAIPQGIATTLRTPSVRSVTSYPSHEEALDLFNSVVRGRIYNSIVQDSGSATQLRFGICCLIHLPFWYWSVSSTFLACDGIPCALDEELQGSYADFVLTSGLHADSRPVDKWLLLQIVGPFCGCSHNDSPSMWGLYWDP